VEKVNQLVTRVFLAAYSDRKGVTAIEYGLIAGLVAVLVIAGASLIGSSLNSVFQNLATQMAPSGRW